MVDKYVSDGSIGEPRMLAVQALVESEELKHEYDPDKRREYYLRTRKLVGRAKKKLGKEYIEGVDKVLLGGKGDLQKLIKQEKFQRETNRNQKTPHTSNNVRSEMDKISSDQKRIDKKFDKVEAAEKKTNNPIARYKLASAKDKLLKARDKNTRKSIALRKELAVAKARERAARRSNDKFGPFR